MMNKGSAGVKGFESGHGYEQGDGTLPCGAIARSFHKLRPDFCAEIGALLRAIPAGSG